MSYLIKFRPDVDPATVEAGLGRLSPPEEGIVLAGSGAVIVQARRNFVEFAKRQDSVGLVNAVRADRWEPNRYQVPSGPD